MRYSIFLLLLCGACFKKDPVPSEGYVHLKEGKVWYSITGSGNKTPLLLLHGGPGVPSDYLSSMSAIGAQRKVIFLDQLGCGLSDSISDPALRTTEAFVEELNAFTDSLHLTSFYLYGHSWGTMLGMDYYLKYPEKIKAIIFASPCISVPLWERDADSLINTFPDSVRNVIRYYEKNNDYSNSNYREAVEYYYDRYLSISENQPIDRPGSRVDDKTYEMMWGPSEFTATGVLRNYDRSGYLSAVKVPVLFTCGEFDEATPKTVKYLAGLVPGSQFAVIKKSAHLTPVDNPAENNRVIKKFLDSVDNILKRTK